MWKEFKAFIMRGNVMDLAVGCHRWRSFRKDRYLFRERRSHAADRNAFGKGEL